MRVPPARRDNVEFFDTSAAARAAGYRPCRKCLPDHGAVSGLDAAVVALCRSIERSPSRPLGEIYAALPWSIRHLRRRFREVVGVTPAEYRRAVLADRARAALAEGHEVLEAAFAAGYGSARGFYEHGASRLGMRPTTYRQGGRGMTIRWTVTPTEIGLAAIAATDTGVCAVQLGDDADELAMHLAAEFPAADVTRDDTGLKDLADIVADLAAGRPVAAPVPLDVAATAFRARVWEALRAIPPGEVRTYGEIAAAIGRPGASRAVGTACATNPVAIITPCHRVVRADGSVGGYRWGVERKTRLLQLERESRG